eukprot:12429837-Karenia_brevis.AAC.1
MRCACSLIDHPRHLSDHRPLSVRLTRNKFFQRSSQFPKWVAEHKVYPKELEEEFSFRMKEFEQLHGKIPGAGD